MAQVMQSLMLLLFIFVNTMNACFIQIMNNGNVTTNTLICNDTIAENVFNGNENINSVIITGCNMKTVPAKLFYGLSKLLDVKLNGNKLAYLDPKIFTRNPNLVNVDLSQNDFTDIPRLESASIKRLDLSENKITKMNDLDVLEALPNLAELNLALNRLMMLTGVVYSLNLHVLDLSYNRIKSIKGGSFSGFPALTTLKLNGNRLVNIPKKELFHKLTTLSCIYLGDNPYYFKCWDSQFLASWTFLTEKDRKIMDKEHVKFNNRLQNTVYYNCSQEIHVFKNGSLKVKSTWLMWFISLAAIMAF